MTILDKINQSVPNSPGCYIYYNEDNEIIYVGKAKKLKNRMRSYFNRDNNIKTQHLVNKIKKFDYFITNNETEALILENNLIKKHTPFYNIVLKDDKTYPYIVLTKEEHPRIIKTRKRNLKGKYYGPYPSSSFVNLVVSYLNKKIPLRQCEKLPKEECMYYYINQCYGGCIKDVSAKEIKKYSNMLDEYLRKDMKKLKEELEKTMQVYASQMLFEEAQKIKEILDVISELTPEQNVQFDKDLSLDFIDYYKDDNFISLSILKVREGKLINIHRSLIPYYKESFEDISSYLYEYYTQEKPEFFSTKNEEIQNIMENLLLVKHKYLENKKLQNLYSISLENAKEYYKQNIDLITREYFAKKTPGFEELQKIANSKLERIEVIDISHIGGDAQVGAIVVYLNGKKASKEYRKYKIKDEKNLQDDYGSIKEVLSRRIKRGLKDNNLPDLLIVDGGKGQVKVALEVFKNFALDEKIKLIGLAKDNKHKTKSIVNKNFEEKILNKSSDLYKFLYMVQEEVHRYAIDFHRQVKVNSLFQSELNNIKGIGPKRKKELVEHFGYVDNLKKATYEELKEIKLPETVIENILNYFKEYKKD